ncbi:MAG: peptide chain release factor N(5)-glutamine methyltransferase [Bacteroidales bacterium]|nr:peptide chain release factor N(5)-glutamine methyltransferase [Bacteroidales bacterium]
MNVPSNRLFDLYRYYSKSLQSVYPIKEAQGLIEILIEHFFDVSKIRLLTESDLRLSESELLTLHFAVKRLKNEEPVQYVTGQTIFCDHWFDVDQSVLIPRPETEQLVEICAGFLSESSNSGVIADIGTGSGCIAICLALRFPHLRVEAFDVSEAALKTAEHNAVRLGAKVSFQQFDVLNDPFPGSGVSYQLVVSNPPYVLMSEKDSMRNNVLGFEPHQALFVPDNDPLMFYRAIAQMVRPLLGSEGMLAFEINERMRSPVSLLLEKEGYHQIRMYQDFHGKDRFVTALR